MEHLRNSLLLQAVADNCGAKGGSFLVKFLACKVIHERTRNQLCPVTRTTPQSLIISISATQNRLSNIPAGAKRHWKLQGSCNNCNNCYSLIQITFDGGLRGMDWKCGCRDNDNLNNLIILKEPLSIWHAQLFLQCLLIRLFVLYSMPWMPQDSFGTLKH
jgi:hypothetical protein